MISIKATSPTMPFIAVLNAAGIGTKVLSNQSAKPTTAMRTIMDRMGFSMVLRQAWHDSYFDGKL